MKWDIDREIAKLLDPAIPEGLHAPGLSRVTMMGYDFIAKWLSKEAADEALARGGDVYVNTWCLSLGLVNQSKMFIYALTIREALLKARRAIRTRSAEDLATYGLRAPTRRKKKAA